MHESGQGARYAHTVFHAQGLDNWIQRFPVDYRWAWDKAYSLQGSRELGDDYLCSREVPNLLQPPIWASATPLSNWANITDYFYAWESREGGGSGAQDEEFFEGEP